MSQQPEPSAKAQEAIPPTAPAAPKLAVGEESAPSRDTLAGAAMSQQPEPSAKAQSDAADRPDDGTWFRYQATGAR